MSSKQAKAKDHCGYQDKPVLPVCGTCYAFRSTMEYPAWVLARVKEDGRDPDAMGYSKQEYSLRCADHGFAVKKMAGCRLWRGHDTVMEQDDPPGEHLTHIHEPRR